MSGAAVRPAFLSRIGAFNLRLIFTVVLIIEIIISVVSVIRSTIVEIRTVMLRSTLCTTVIVVAGRLVFWRIIAKTLLTVMRILIFAVISVCHLTAAVLLCILIITVIIVITLLHLALIAASILIMLRSIFIHTVLFRFLNLLFWHIYRLLFFYSFLFYRSRRFLAVRFINNNQIGIIYCTKITFFNIVAF